MLFFGPPIRECTVLCMSIDSLTPGAIDQDPDELYRRIYDETLSYDVRGAALGVLVLKEDSRLPKFFATQLQRADLDGNWRATLIHGAERTQFLDENVRATVKNCTLEFARSIRTVGEKKSMTNAWSALRKYSSMADDSELLPLGEFLSDDTPPGIQLCALNGISNALWKEPPQVREPFRTMSDRAYQIAATHIRPGTETGPEEAALMISAIDALHKLGDSRAEKCVQQLKELKSEWYEDALQAISSATA